MRIANLPVSVVAARLLPTRWDLLVVPLLLVTFVLLAHGARQMAQPLTALDMTPLTLDPRALPGYALRTTQRTPLPVGLLPYATLLLYRWRGNFATSSSPNSLRQCKRTILATLQPPLPL